MIFLKMFTVLCCVLIVTTSSVYAEYVATGPFEITVCKGFVVEFCGHETIDAVKGADGKPYSMKKSWQTVDKYSNGTCYLNTPIKNASPIYSGPVFLHYNKSGKLKKLNYERGSQVRFPCKIE